LRPDTGRNAFQRHFGAAAAAPSSTTPHPAEFADTTLPPSEAASNAAVSPGKSRRSSPKQQMPALVPCTADDQRPKVAEVRRLRAPPATPWPRTPLKGCGAVVCSASLPVEHWALSSPFGAADPLSALFGPAEPLLKRPGADACIAPRNP